MVVDMTDDPDLDAHALTEAIPEGIAVRAWFGLKQVWESFSVFAFAPEVYSYTNDYSALAASYEIPALRAILPHKHPFRST